MGEIIKFYESAFKHNISREDIKHALKTRVYDVMLTRFPEKYAAIGFDTAGNPLEILYHEIDDDTVKVFHAMRVRKTFLAKLDI